MLDYRLQAENDSLYNTPPVFAIYVLLLIARWLKNDVGGLAKMAEHQSREGQAAVRRARRARRLLSRPRPARLPLA